MSTAFHTTPDGVYTFNADATVPDVYKSISARLAKAEALAIIAANLDLDAYAPDIVSNYLWALSDMVRESKALYEEITRKPEQN